MIWTLDPHGGSLEKVSQPPCPDHPYYTLIKKVPIILKTLFVPIYFKTMKHFSFCNPTPGMDCVFQLWAYPHFIVLTKRKKN